MMGRFERAQLGWLGAVLFSQLVATSIATCEDVPPSGNESGDALLRAAVLRGSQWNSGHVEIAVSGHFQTQPFSTAWEVFFDGDRVKGYRRAGGSSIAAGEALPAEVLCANCLASGTLLHFGTGDSSVGGPFALSLYDSSQVSGPNMWIPDPRVLGVVPLSFLMHHGTHVEAYYSGEVTQDLSVTDDQLDGVPCIKLVQDRFATTRLEIWLQPLASNALVRAVLTSDLGGREMVDDLRVNHAFYEELGLWLPQSSRYVRTTDGVQECQEEVAYRFLSLNKPLPPDTFDVSSIPALPPGRTVNWVSVAHPPPGPFGALIWDGERIIEAELGGSPVRDLAPIQPRGGISILIAANALILCLIVAVFLWKRKSSIR